MAERFLSGPAKPRPKLPFSLVNSHPLQIGPETSRARSGASGPLTARTDLEQFAVRERGQATPAGGLLRGFPQRSMKGSAHNRAKWGIHFIQVHPMGCGLAAPSACLDSIPAASSERAALRVSKVAVFMFGFS